MKEYEQDLLALLRAFVQGNAPELSGSPNVGRILELAEINSVGGPACLTLLKSPAASSPETAFSLRGRVKEDMVCYLNRGEAAKALLKKLDEAGLDCLVFKGFVVRDYYPMPEMRSFGDIDFAVRQEDRERSHALMTEMGFECTVDYEPVYTYQRGAEKYEIHTDVMSVNVSDRSATRDYFRSLWAHTRPCEAARGAHILEFTPEYHFLYMLAHIAKHISRSGAGVRMYLDLAFTAQRFRETMDWAYIADELRKLHLDSFAGVALTAAEQWFGEKNPLPDLREPVPQEIMDEFFAFTTEGGTFGYIGRDESVVYLTQQNRSGGKSSRIRTVLEHAFPPVSSLQDRYVYLQKRRWLLPAAWMQRLIDRRSEWGRYVDDTKKILTADPEEVKKLKSIYQAIGL